MKILLLILLFSVSHQTKATLRNYFSRNFDSKGERERGRTYKLPNKDQILQSFGRNQSRCNKISSDTLSVLVWNMYKADKPTWGEDFLFLSKDRDLILTQEVYYNDLMKDTFQKTPYIYKYAQSFIYQKTSTSTGIATASKCSPTESIAQRSIPREPFLKTPKMVLLTKYNTNFGELLVINIHAINFVSYLELNQQLMQAFEVAKNFKGRMIFAGDFNTWSYTKTLVVKMIAKRLRLKEAQFSPDQRMRSLGHPIDFFFYRGFEVLDTKVWGSIEGSDHKAMDVSLKFI